MNSLSLPPLQYIPANAFTSLQPAVVSISFLSTGTVLEKFTKEPITLSGENSNYTPAAQITTGHSCIQIESSITLFPNITAFAFFFLTYICAAVRAS